MKLALEQAEKAMAVGEVPVGCIIVDKNNKVISSSFNLKESNYDPCGHAEIIAIREAAKTLGNWRLKDCRMYVTLEPCTMCMGALVHSRINDLVFGAYDLKAGAISLGQNLHQNPMLNHRFSVVGGVMHFEASRMLSTFFKQRRAFYRK